MVNRVWAVTFTVTDLERAADFYENILGLTRKYQYRDYAGFDCGGVEIGLRTWGGGEEPRAGEPGVDLLVDDIDEAFDRLKRAGVRFQSKPIEAAWGARIATFTDPDGNSLQLVQIDWRKYFAAALE